MFKKLAAFGAPVLAICAVLALSVLGSTTAYAGGDDGTASSSTSPTTSPAGTNGNPWHG